MERRVVPGLSTWSVDRRHGPVRLALDTQGWEATGERPCNPRVHGTSADRLPSYSGSEQGPGRRCEQGAGWCRPPTCVTCVAWSPPRVSGVPPWAPAILTAAWSRVGVAIARGGEGLGKGNPGLGVTQGKSTGLCRHSSSRRWKGGKRRTGDFRAACRHLSVGVRTRLPGSLVARLCVPLELGHFERLLLGL